MKIQSFLAILAATSMTFGCGGGDQPSNGDVIFKLDAATCPTPTTAPLITFTIDGSDVGTETMVAGAASKPYSTGAGEHILSARISTKYSWPGTKGTVPAGSTFTFVLTCT